MAKSKHNDFLDSVNDILNDAKSKGVVHLYMDDEDFDGRHISMQGRKLYHFGTTTYMGLDQDLRLKEAAIRAILKFGTQFPLSKSYLSQALYKELEDNLTQLYGHHVLVTKNSTIGHMGVIPSIIKDEDMVILDHQVHHSVQNACNILKIRSIPVEMIRHSSLDMLEFYIKKYKDRVEKIWYMVDGVYSMYGDFAPLPELMQLMEQYPQLHIYADDVHGMSWTGKHGAGFVMSELGKLPEKVVMMSTLSKSFGASGAVMVTSDKKLMDRVKLYGGVLTFSAQLEPASIAAALASSRIHLSDEIYDMQNDLTAKISYCNTLIADTDLPLIVENRSPLFYIGTGLPSAGYNLVDRMLKEGYYVNLGVFPAVPAKNTGIRFTISRNNRKEDIKGLVDALNHHYPLMLADEQQTNNGVRKLFGVALSEKEEATESVHNGDQLSVELFDSIDQIDRNLWDTYHGTHGMYDYNGMKFLEKSYQGNLLPEQNWIFKYIIIKDKKGAVVLLTFCTVSMWKEDMLSIAAISRKVEEERKKDPYYLTSYIVQTGTNITEGTSIYLNRKSKHWKDAVFKLCQVMEEMQEKHNASTVLIREFEEGDDELNKYVSSKGYVKIVMPEASVVEGLPYKDEEEFINKLSYKSRRHFRTDLLRNKDVFRVEAKDKLTDTERKLVYELYMNVARNNFDINQFVYPEKVFECVEQDPNFTYILFHVNDQYKLKPEDDLVGFAILYQNSKSGYTGWILGMEYEYMQEYRLYKHIMYQSIEYANAKGCDRFFLGVTAATEKKKLGATVYDKIAFVQAKDNYTLEKVETMSTIKK